MQCPPVAEGQDLFRVPGDLASRLVVHDRIRQHQQDVPPELVGRGDLAVADPAPDRLEVHRPEDRSGIVGRVGLADGLAEDGGRSGLDDLREDLQDATFEDDRIDGVCRKRAQRLLSQA